MPSATARNVFLDSGYVIGDPDFGYGVQIGTAGTHGVYIGQTGPARPADRLVSEVNSQWAEPGPGGDIVDGPAVYLLAWFFEGRVPAGLERRVKPADLATVWADYAGDVPGSVAEKYVFTTLPGKYEHVFSWNLPLRPPHRRTEFYNADPGARRGHVFIDDIVANDPPEVAESMTFLTTPKPVAYEAGKAYREVWNKGVLGPAFPPNTQPSQWVWRTGDTLVEGIPLYSDSFGHAGASGIVQGNTFLYRDGILVGTAPAGTQDAFELPPQDAAYRLEVHATRLGSPTLSTTMLAAWTFRSQHVDGSAPARLPLSAIRFLPALDERNTAPAGSVFHVPIRVERQVGAGPARVSRLTVEVSYDGGATWHPAPVTPTSTGGVATLHHPAEPGFVSLRATMADQDGSTAELTVGHAYRIA